MESSVDRARRAAPGTRVDGLLLGGDPAAELLRLAADADEVVLGPRGAGGFTALVLGSVAANVAAHAPVPAVVVRGSAPAPGPVVVGADGSPPAEAALAYGFAHAARHGHEVQVLHAYPDYVVMSPYPMLPVDVDRVREDASRAARDALHRWSRRYPEVLAEWIIAQGSAARRLVEASQGSTLLVVGCRGHGGFTGLVLGSVSQAVIRHAGCPVAVAR